MKNEHAKNQIRTKKKTFAPKWTPKTIIWIINELQKMTSVNDIAISLISEYKISPRTTESWIKIARNVMVDMNNGLSLEKSLSRDLERRNLLRRKNATLHRKETGIA